MRSKNEGRPRFCLTYLIKYATRIIAIGNVLWQLIFFTIRALCSKEEIVIQVKAILMHKRPHFDEMVCDWESRKFGRDMYPGIQDAEILLEGAATAEMLGASAKQLMAEGVLSFGRWDGEFDEHTSVHSPGVPGKCAADLVAEKLGINQHPALRPLLDFANQADLKAEGHQLDLACMVKTMHSIHRNDPYKVIAWAQEGIEAMYQAEARGIRDTAPKICTTDLAIQLLGSVDPRAMKQVLRLTQSDTHPFGLGRVAAAIRATSGSNKAIEWATAGLQALYQKQLSFILAQEVAKNARQELVHVGHKTAKVLIAQTDDEQFSDAARFAGAAVVIQRNTSGNVQIYTNKNRRKLGFGVKLDEVARCLRIAEQKAKHAVLTVNRDELSAEGTVAGAEEWYYHTAGQFILNGSLTADNNPTKIPLDEIVEIVKQGIYIYW